MAVPRKFERLRTATEAELLYFVILEPRRVPLITDCGLLDLACGHCGVIILEGLVGELHMVNIAIKCPRCGVGNVAHFGNARR